MNQIHISEAIKYLDKHYIEAHFIRNKSKLIYFFDKNNKYILAIGDPGYNLSNVIQIYSKEEITVDFLVLLKTIRPLLKEESNLYIYAPDKVYISNLNCSVYQQYTRYQSTRPSFIYKSVEEFDIISDYEFLKKCFDKENLYFSKELFSRNIFICLKKDNQIIAIAGTHHISKENSISTLCGLVWVDHRFRRQGYGEKIVQEMNNFISNSLQSIISWDIEKLNIPSKKMFDKFNLINTESRFNIYNITAKGFCND